jgi:hypothetical protein
MIVVRPFGAPVLREILRQVLPVVQDRGSRIARRH